MNSYYWIALWLGVTILIGTVGSWHAAGVITGVWLLAWSGYQVVGDIPRPTGP